MSKRLDVLNAIKALVIAALPGAEVVGLDEQEGEPARVSAGGRVEIYAGEPGEPEMDLSPLTYNYAHAIPVQVLMPNEAALDAALVAIGTSIEADRQLGGLCEWLDATAPNTENVRDEGTKAVRFAPLAITALYSSLSPLT